MNIQTKYHGEISIDETKIIDFPEGIPSFLEEKQFTILPFTEDGTFSILQSIHTPSLAFVIINPFDFFKEYSIKLSDAVIESLAIEKEADVLLYTILTIHEPFKNTTTNLQGPIVINTPKQLGKQVILADSPYETKHLLTSQLSTTAGKEG